MTDADPARQQHGQTAPSTPDGADADATPAGDYSQGAQRSTQNELRQVEERVDGLRARMRNAVDLLGVLLLGLSGAALLVVTVLAVVGFIGNDTGIGLLFSALAVICLPLVAFAGWRAFQPLWLLSRELTTLRAHEQQLRAKLGPPLLPPVRGAPLVRGRPKEEEIAQRLPPGRSPTGWRAPPPSKDFGQMLSTRQVGWRVVVLIALIMALFAAGVLLGVLARPH
jgi:hypothetical protein